MNWTSIQMKRTTLYPAHSEENKCRSPAFSKLAGGLPNRYRTPSPPSCLCLSELDLGRLKPCCRRCIESNGGSEWQVKTNKKRRAQLWWEPRKEYEWENVNEELFLSFCNRSFSGLSDRAIYTSIRWRVKMVTPMVKSNSDIHKPKINVCFQNVF